MRSRPKEHFRGNQLLKLHYEFIKLQENTYEMPLKLQFSDLKTIYLTIYNKILCNKIKKNCIMKQICIHTITMKYNLQSL